MITNLKKNTRLLIAFTCLAASAQAGWKKDLSEQLPLLGHRNWVVVADSAYPLQTAPGIKTVYVGGDHVDVVSDVLDLVAKQKHVRPVIFTDAELEHVSEAHAPGIESVRDELQALLTDSGGQTLAHEAIIDQLDEAGKTFEVVIIKTDLVLPYTSVFIRLDCGYWSADAEAALRESMRSRKE
jgi:D-ribose pyranose/furanose isomerase RbsD